jgi:hypothetical protein
VPSVSFRGATPAADTHPLRHLAKPRRSRQAYPESSQVIFDGKDRIRDWIDEDIAYLRKGAECAAWSNVQEGADRLDFYEECTIEEVLWQGHHTLYFEDGKIRSWTMTFRQIE